MRLSHETKAVVLMAIAGTGDSRFERYIHGHTPHSEREPHQTTVNFPGEPGKNLQTGVVLTIS